MSIQEPAPKRATLSFGDDPPDDKPPVPAPVVPVEKIKEATRAAGFHETPRPAERSGATPAPALAPVPLRRARRKTDRTYAFATRLKETTVQEIHDYADRHEITLAEVIERGLGALLGRSKV